MRHSVVILFFLSVMLTTAAEAKTIKVLTVGNSFSKNASTYLVNIAKSVPDCEIVLTRADIGGCSLEKHAALIKECEANHELKPYFKKYSLKELLQKDTYDVITIQQVSHQSFKPETFQPYANELVAYIKKHAPTAKIMIHQTWAYAPDSSRLPGFNITRDQMHAGLVKSYNQLSQELGGLELLKSGAAFYKSFAENPQIDLWNAKDRFHASEEGCYLAGCVWFGTLFNVSPMKISYQPKGMDAQVAAKLRSTAASVLK